MCLSKENVLRWGEVKWYYDAVAEHGPDVPEAIARRVRRCLVFRKQIDRLQEAVTGAGGEADASRSKMKRDIIDTLSEHFHCLNEQVTCSRVKPFLPSLLLPTVQVRIPTPITVHVDHCAECAEDLEALRDLGLDPEQLERLERLYRAPATRDRRLCRKARARIAAFVGGSLAGIEEELLDHLCTCARCRSLVYRDRQKLLENEANDAGPEDDVCAAELFDYAVPYGRTSADVPQGGYTPVPTGRPYLKRIQELDETLYGIAERTDSGIATVYSTVDSDTQPRRQTVPDAEDVEASGVAESYSDPYPGYPIHVQVIRGLPQPATPHRFPAEIKATCWRAACNPQVRFLLKTGLAVAAVLLFAWLFRTTGSGSGITLAQMFKALGKADNVHVSRFHPATGQLFQELWLSRTKNRVVATDGQGRTLFDLGTGKKSTHPAAGGPAEVTDMTETQHGNVRRSMDACLGFTMSDVPAGAEWTRVEENTSSDVEVYELTYTEESRSGVTALRKWRFSIDAAKGLPTEVLVFRRATTEEEWHPLSRIELQYPTDDEMTAAIGSF